MGPATVRLTSAAARLDVAACVRTRCTVGVQPRLLNLHSEAERRIACDTPSHLRPLPAEHTEIAGNCSTIAMVPGIRELDRLDPVRDGGNAGRATAVPGFADKKAESVTG